MSYPSIKDQNHRSWKTRWHEIIFGAETKEGRRFDVVLLWAIFLSVLVVMAESVNELQVEFSSELLWLEYFFTVIFTVEYIIRIMVSPNPRAYLFSFWGIIDLLSTLPSYLAIFIHGPQFFRILRIVRLLRIFRVLRLTSFMQEAQGLGMAVRRSSAKIIVFFGIVLAVVIVMGTLMYVIESPEAGFTSIPRSIYWAIVTLTTVGYGDIAPQTPLGQFLSAALMILGYAVIAVPTGIVSVEMSQSSRRIACQDCGADGHGSDAYFCRRCGAKLK